MLQMKRQASDNPYMHKDFHISMDIGLSYIGEHYGARGVTEYLTTLAEDYYAPLSARIKAHGLSEMEAYLEQIYAAENANDAISITISGGVLQATITYCPAILHMNQSGHTPSIWYIETMKTLYSVIAERADCWFELISYDCKTGASEFYIREVKNNG